MSTKQKRKPKTKAPTKRKPRAVKRHIAPERKPEKKVVELPPEKAFTIAIRIDGSVATPVDIDNTLRSLRLDRKFTAVLIERSPNVDGMLKKAKDYVTWGEVSNEALAELLKERAEVPGGLALTNDFVRERFKEKSVDGLASALTHGQVKLSELWQKGVKPVFRLHPPSGGFQYSTKRPFASRGELGYRAARISELMIRMI